MNILLLGSGGREHAIGWKVSQSPKVDNLFIAPGNAGTSDIGKNVPLSPNDFPGIRQFVLDNKIVMVIVGPEDPLVNGIHDFFLEDEQLKNVPVIGPVKQAAMLEGSKEFGKQFMSRHGIPTAAYKTFTKDNLEEGIAFINCSHPPYVLKADGLAAGKGVVICPTADEARLELHSMLMESKFGAASARVVIEEFLKGIELSVFVLSDGKTYKILPEAKDYKKIGEGDTGHNTGGMGSVSPVSFANKQFMDKVENKIIIPTIEGLKSENIDYRGFIFFGLINVEGDPYVIEYNCRMGDPEAESVIPRIQNDLVDLFLAVSSQQLEKEVILTDPRFTGTVMLVSKGYPDQYEKGKVITKQENIEDSILFHAGTKTDTASGNIVTNGGRVIAVTSFGNSMKEALSASYKNATKIEFEGKQYRKDIGFDL
ncbi:MAG: phosphoribosylamine--glycine ligase [Bacteroidetes bacterium]|nr:MAG: phosphoribosylamine--glycine ligase [Bacteroidota bacterium]